MDALLPGKFLYYMRNWKLSLRFSRSLPNKRLTATRIGNAPFINAVYRLDQWALQDVPWDASEQRLWLERHSGALVLGRRPTLTLTLTHMQLKVEYLRCLLEPSRVYSEKIPDAPEALLSSSDPLGLAQGRCFFGGPLPCDQPGEAGGLHAC